MISPGFFVFSKFLGGGGWGEGAKRQKMDKMFWFFWLLVGLKCKKCPKMIKWCLSHCISQDARITRFWFLVHMCKIMTSPDFFFHFLKILIFWIVRGVKVKNGQNDKEWCPFFYVYTSMVWNCTSYDCAFWYTCVKLWYLQQVFTFFQNFDFLWF